jgi:hypothetical protein
MRKFAQRMAAVLAIGLAAGLVWAASAAAQTYPPPAGSLSVTASSTTPGGSSNVSATVLDDSGAPIEGAEVTFTIISQPGSDARFANGETTTTGTTGADGVATVVLYAGADPGSIIIETQSGEQTSQVTVAVEESAAGPAEVPSTGAAPGDGGIPLWQLAFVLIGLGALAGGLWRLRRANREA